MAAEDNESLSPEISGLTEIAEACINNANAEAVRRMGDKFREVIIQDGGSLSTEQDVVDVLVAVAKMLHALHLGFDAFAPTIGGQVSPVTMVGLITQLLIARQPRLPVHH
jgi:hypothetical protein